MIFLPLGAKPVASTAKPEKVVRQTSDVFEHHAFSEEMDECVDNKMGVIPSDYSRFACGGNVVINLESLTASSRQLVIHKLR